MEEEELFHVRHRVIAFLHPHVFDEAGSATIQYDSAADVLLRPDKPSDRLHHAAGGGHVHGVFEPLSAETPVIELAQAFLAQRGLGIGYADDDHQLKLFERKVQSLGDPPAHYGEEHGALPGISLEPPDVRHQPFL